MLRSAQRLQSLMVRRLKVDGTILCSNSSIEFCIGNTPTHMKGQGQPSCSVSFFTRLCKFNMHLSRTNSLANHLTLHFFQELIHVHVSMYPCVLVCVCVCVC